MNNTIATYKQDTETRRKRRLNYRDKAVKDRTIVSDVAEIVSLGSKRQVDDIDTITFTVPECASVLGRTIPSLYNWIRDKKFPAPSTVGIGTSDNVPYSVYLLKEVIAFSNILSDHQKDKLALGIRDIETITKLHAVSK